ncbi:unnamed protein product [Schistocephalus solidus]|uniref:Uncharacterized protein n=1 Tax=Schistocephalus solidus TaxID=70667 RepID=A0A183SJX4_SCHSO|nr:unnamed protein product [Schistocephalus solidus]
MANTFKIGGSGVPSTMGNNSLRKLIKELQKLAVHSAPPPEKRTPDTDFALNTRVLEQLVAGVRDPQIQKFLLRDRPSTLEKALAVAREEEVLQATYEQPPRSLFGVSAVQPHSSHDASI